MHFCEPNSQSFDCPAAVHGLSLAIARWGSSPALVHELAAEDTMKIDGRCHCGYITLKPRLSRTRPCSAIALTARHSPAPRSACTPSRGKTLSGCSRANRKSTSRPPRAETRGRRRFARNVEHQFMRRLIERDRRFTPSEWAPFVNAINLSQMWRYGFAPRSNGSPTETRCGKSKSNLRSIPRAR